MERNLSIFDRQYGRARMELNGLSCELHLPHALISRHDAAGNEIALPLPPGNPRPSFAVADYDGACPTNWMRGSANAASYFIPVKKDHGLWLNFNGNQHHRHHVAAVVSIQGINAVTGQKSDKLVLEQYRNNCPVHNEPFGERRFCPKCCNGKGMFWPHQNYLATTGTPEGYFWLDGFRAEDGVTRQFVFTDDVMRGVAARLIGDQRVFALGVSFFLSKEPKPPVYHSRPRGMYLGGGGGLESYGGGSEEELGFKSAIGHTNFLSDEGEALCEEVNLEGQPSEPVLACAEIEEIDGPYEASPVCRRVAGGPQLLGAPPPAAVPVGHAPMRVSLKKFEIKAGARIDQEVYRDDCEPSFWQDEPAAVFYLNYVDEEAAYAILAQGPSAVRPQQEGFLADLPVGHHGPGNA